MKTYISLFSSAGIGCYGFKLEGFDCIATNELIERRLNIQKSNNKCEYQTGYICGDITTDETKKQLYDEIEFWKSKEKLKHVDVVIATPPCQGMSVANHKKTDTEIIRNSLVVESIKIIKEIHPNFFVFENVPAFMKTICTDIDGTDKPIAEAISNNLGSEYSYASRVINFKNYGACSSRTRTVVIGVSKSFADEVSPYELYPQIKAERTLREVIGNMKRLNTFGEIDPNDIYHSFRTYPENMRAWITNLKEGESAFDNNTRSIDLAAQKVLLIAKTYSIRQNLTSMVEEHVFEFYNFLQVLSVGWSDNTVLEIADNDYNDVIHAINYHYVV
jgi:DNA (cytosine-5)-methyltransferase 1